MKETEGRPVRKGEEVESFVAPLCTTTLHPDNKPLRVTADNELGGDLQCGCPLLYNGTDRISQLQLPYVHYILITI